MTIITERLRHHYPKRGKRHDVCVFDTYITYSVHGRRYCQGRSRGGRPKIVYESMAAAQNRADEMLDVGRVRWEYQHFDHWHLTSLVPLLIGAIPPAIPIGDGPGSKKRQARHVIPYRPKPKFRGGSAGHHFGRIRDAI